jgi:hypothetical protein
MYDKRFKYVQWFLYVLIGISAILGIIFYLNSSSEGAMNNMIYFMYIVGIIALVTIIATALFSLFVTPKGAYKLLLVIIGMVVIAILCYVSSSNEFDIIHLEKWKITAGLSKTIGAGMYFMWIMLIATFASLIYSAVIRFFK